MNRENILAVADAIEAAARPEAKPKLGFNMSSFISNSQYDNTGHACGTTACIAGWARMVETRRKPSMANEESIAARAAMFLALDEERSYDLFYPHAADEFWSEITPAHAVAVLRHLADTGVVDWSVVPATPHLEERDSHG